MIAAYRDGLRPLLRDGGFDVVHAQDCISANAALDAARRGRDRRTWCAPCTTSTTSRSPSLIACQDRSILEPDHVLCVSQPWVERARATSSASRPGSSRNGVDPRPLPPAARRRRARAPTARAAGLGDRLAVLTVGGIEPRKGSLTLLEGFAARCARALPERDPLLLIAGGATLFDYRDEIERFARARGGARRRRATCACSARSSTPSSSASTAPPTSSRSPRRRRASASSSLEALAAGLPVGRVRPRRLPRLPGRRRERAARARRRRRRAGRRARARRARPGARRAAARRRARGRRALHAGTRAAAAHERAYRDFLARARPDGRGPRGHRALARRLRAPTSSARGHAVARRRARRARRRATTGLMPTELFCAALASCFCLAVGHVARKRDDRACPGLRVTRRAERAGRELRYGAARASRAPRTSTTTTLDALIERARPFCWVSNTLAAGVEVEYGRLTEGNARSG